MWSHSSLQKEVEIFQERAEVWPLWQHKKYRCHGPTLAACAHVRAAALVLFHFPPFWCAPRPIWGPGWPQEDVDPRPRARRQKSKRRPRLQSPPRQKIKRARIERDLSHTVAVSLDHYIKETDALFGIAKMYFDLAQTLRQLQSSGRAVVAEVWGKELQTQPSIKVVSVLL